jgi:non-heme chloroperoxidase
MAWLYAGFSTQKQWNPAVTEFREIAGRGHSLTIDHGWREVAEIALSFIAKQLLIG